MNPESTSLTADPMGSPAPRITLLTSVTCFPREQILAMIPPRRVVDRHLSYFFNTFDFAPGEFLFTLVRSWANECRALLVILHRETFIAEVSVECHNSTYVCSFHLVQPVLGRFLIRSNHVDRATLQHYVHLDLPPATRYRILWLIL